MNINKNQFLKKNLNINNLNKNNISKHSHDNNDNLMKVFLLIY